MELRHLRYFIAVAEEENVTRAAARLHVAQPALSRQIRDLEQALGVALFEHTARTVRLTAAGRHFLEEARGVISRFQQAVHSVREFAHGAEEEFHLGYAPSLTTRILPQALREFQSACPRVCVKLHDLSTGEMLAGLRERTLDAALLVRLRNPAADGLLYDEIARFRPSVALSWSHRLADVEHLGVRDLAGEPLIGYRQSDYPEYREWLEQVFDGGNVPRMVVESDSSSSLIAAVETGSDLAVVQEGFDVLAGGRLKVRLLRGAEKAVFSFGVARRKDDASEAVSKFVHVLRSVRTTLEAEKKTASTGRTAKSRG